MKVLAVASECFPWIKTGGLADVVGSLPTALAHEGATVRTLIPAYPEARAALPETTFLQDLGQGRALHAAGDLFLLYAPDLFDRPGGPYQSPDGADWPDNAERFAALCRAAADIALGLLPDWRPDLVHAHDWQAALTPAYLRFAGQPTPPTVLTIHNLAFRGLFPASLLPGLGLPWESFTPDGLEFYDQLSFLKAGIAYADLVTTVSPTYAREITTPEHGMGFDGLLRTRPLAGILNGLDTTTWDPAADPLIATRYDARTLPARLANKPPLQSAFALTPDTHAPLFGVVSRLSHQKGLDLLLEALPTLLECGAQLALLGTGDPALESAFRAAAAAHPGRIGIRIGYDEPTAHLIQAGADALLVPSRFEPCGLTQLAALRYACLPVVARTGGLADTVTDETGIRFAPDSAAALADAIRRTVARYREPNHWRALQHAAIATDVSWTTPARHYAAAFRALAS